MPKGKRIKETPEQQFKNAHRELLNRWIEESDIDDVRIAEIAKDDVDEWLEEEVVAFDCDMDFGEDEDAEEEE
jgi:hypothetical protein